MNDKTMNRCRVANKGRKGSKFNNLSLKVEDKMPEGTNHIHHEITVVGHDTRFGGTTRFSELTKETRDQLKPILIKKSTLAASRIKEGIPAGLKLLGAMDALGFSAHISPDKLRI